MMATDQNVPPPEPVEPLSPPPEPGEVQTTPMPMARSTPAQDDSPAAQESLPVQGENQAGFIGERNRAHS